MAQFTDAFSSGWATLILNISESGTSSITNAGTVNWSLQIRKDKTCQSYNLNSADVDVVIGGISRYAGSSFDIRSLAVGSTKTIASGSFPQTHDSNGKLSLSCSASLVSGVGLGNASLSGTFTGTTIARTSGLTIPNGTLGEELAIEIDRKNTSFTDTITYECGDVTGTIVTNTSEDSVSFTPPLTLASENTIGTSVSIKFTVETFSGATSIGTKSVTISCTIPESIVPTVSVSVSDAMGYLSTFGKYVKGQSKLKVVVTSSGAYGSTIESCVTEADGKSYTDASFTTEVIAGSGTLIVKVTVKDSRGRSATTSKEISVYDYAVPKITSMKVKRCTSSGVISSSGAYLAVVFDATATSLDKQNKITYKVKYKKTSETSYTTVTASAYSNAYSVSEGKYVFPAVTSSAYDVILEITDSFKTVEVKGIGGTVKKVWSILRRGLGFAFGKVAELENVLDIAFQTRFYGGILHLILDDETDLNEVLTPNTYAGKDITTAGYLNCPVSEGRFTLEVISCGGNGEVLQRFTTCSKKDSLVYERFYYDDAWGEWICKFSELNNKLTACDTYATTEVKTGETWIDGKPIYRKVVDCGSLSSTNKDVAHGISNVAKIWIDFADTFMEASNGNTYPILRNDISSTVSASYISYASAVTVLVNASVIAIRCGSNAGFSKVYVTVRYTKTTD